MTSRLKKTRRELERLRKLLKRAVASRTAFENTQFALSALLVERKSLNNQLARSQLQKEKSKIRAPFAGMVISKNVEVGEWLSASKSVVSLASEADLIALVSVSELAYSKLKPEQEISVRMVALGKQVSGKLLRATPVVNKRNKTVALKIKLPPQDEVLQFMSVEAELPIGKRQQLQMFSRDALIRFQGKDYVYRVQDGKAVPEQVQIRYRQGSKVGVTAGKVNAKTPLVVDGNDRLTPGKQVSVIR